MASKGIDLLAKRADQRKKEMERLKREANLEQFIVQAFEENYERMRLEGGHSIAPEVKKQALYQVLMYYQKLKGIAETVTDTEVKLTLPQRTSPNGNQFTIEGVVDIIRDMETEETTMYDIKTHDAAYVNDNKEQYESQLNVYSYIWQELRQKRLDKTAIVATQFPKTLKKALDEGNLKKIDRELEKWDPIIELPFNQRNVDDTILEFACVVDKIEGREFSPPPFETLNKKVEGTRQKFATRVCRNCDARFSCDSYREYSQKTASFAGGFTQYISDLGANEDVETFTNANALENPAPDNIDDLI